MKKTDKIIKIALTLLFGVGVYLFWAIPYRSVLSYHEQFQLFLFDWHYLIERLSWPGGAVTYVAEFLVQLFNNYWIGSIVIALALVAIQQLTYHITNRYSPSYGSLRFVLSFVPAIAMWMLMGDINYLFSYTIAVITVLLIFWLCTYLDSAKLRVVVAVVSIPAVYWIAGSVVYLFTALICLDVITRRGKSYLKALECMFLLAYVIVIVIASSYFLDYPMSQVIMGINYYRILVEMPAMMIAVPIVELLTIGACMLLCHRPRTINASYKMTPFVALAVVIAVGWYGMDRCYDARIKEFADYDYLIRTNRWQDIIKKAEKESPNTPLSLCATNFALAMTNQLCDRAFDINQHGVEGLIPAFQRDANSSLVLAEIYYQLGLINTAQRLTFEAMEAITNFNKSSRCIKRLIETNMLRGDYAVAEKYLKLLDKTMMYRKWANRMRQLIDNPADIDRNPSYGRLRKIQLDESFLFSEQEIDKIMGQLVLHNPENTLAMQYLLMYPLMQRDLDKFMRYLEVVQKTSPYYRPVVCQQAVAMAYVNAGMEIPKGMIDGYVLQQFSDFARTMTTSGKDSPALDRFKKTLWYYMVKN